MYVYQSRLTGRDVVVKRKSVEGPEELEGGVRSLNYRLSDVRITNLGVKVMIRVKG